MNTSNQKESESELSLELRVTHTENRRNRQDYLVQLHEETAERLRIQDDDLVLIQHTLNGFTTNIQARLQIRNDLGKDEAGLDFTIRYALGAISKSDIEHGQGHDPDHVTISSAKYKEVRWCRRLSNRILGVRPESCRVRMAVQPDLENNICRLPENTMDLIGVQEGDRVVVESAEGIVRNLNAFCIDEDSKVRKQNQKQTDPDRYPDCHQTLELRRLRDTGEDLPEIYLDFETRDQLNISNMMNEGACQPVRVYRDTFHQFLRISDSLFAALLISLVGASISMGGYLGISVSLVAGFLAILILICRSRRLIE